MLFKLSFAVTAVSALVLSSLLVPATARADDDDFLKAVAGVATIAIIASQIKKGKDAQRAANAAEAEAARLRADNARLRAQRAKMPVCNSAYHDGSTWRNNDGRECRVTPQVCLRSQQRRGRTFSYFDSECMWNEGFRLSSLR
ncbi:MAG: hypothetical protein OXF74_11160 [Rhodobacteraceae bacterium]|nr:hypothetical protein [Paracoccaceae bacterium]